MEAKNHLQNKSKGLRIHWLKKLVTSLSTQPTQTLC